MSGCTPCCNRPLPVAVTLHPVATSKPPPKRRGRGRNRHVPDSGEENESVGEPTEEEDEVGEAEAVSTEESANESDDESDDESTEESSEEGHEEDTVRRQPGQKARPRAKTATRHGIWRRRCNAILLTILPVPHYLLCTVSSLAVEEVRYPHNYCTHIIYTHAEFDFNKKAFVAPMASLSFSSFLASKSKWANESVGPRYLVSLSPAFVLRNAYQMATNDSVRTMIEWLQSKSLSGLALVEHVIHGEERRLLRQLFKGYPSSGLELVLGFSSGQLQELQPTIQALSSQVDYMILETHVKQFPDNCIAVFPTAFNASRNPKVLQLKSNLYPRPVLEYVKKQPRDSGHAKMCISILMGVLMYIVPSGLIHAPSQDCIDFSWQAYSEARAAGRP
ncbi:hypothetical protein HPB48_013065 [Haemaphysalis longicornis]|uniref:Uncharacterized protein n=1 Tax=Haemaphysalis longicornis TaxID=44386 RepID=A0A9J6GPW8_HAELO|nr:hypothetical protein HPB48_013065 [Haemaphysalis longicornis]